MEETGFEGGKPCMIRRIPNGSRARGMNAKHPSVSKCMETEKSEGNSVEKHFTVVIHRRCDMEPETLTIFKQSCDIIRAEL